MKYKLHLYFLALLLINFLHIKLLALKWHHFSNKFLFGAWLYFKLHIIDVHCTIFTGDNCELDFDGCSYQPCSVGQDCIDYNATYHQFQAKAYECSACPDGYDTNNDRCQGINKSIN